MANEYEGRLRVLGIVVILIISALILRAGYLQVYNGEYYSRLADGNRIRVIPYTAPRGLFYDRHGESLVSNRPGFTVSLLPLNSRWTMAASSRLWDRRAAERPCWRRRWRSC